MTGPQDWATMLGLSAATLAGLAGCAAAVVRIARGRGHRWLESLAAGLVTLIAATVFIHRAIHVHEAWTPLEYHVDGLALLVAMLGATVLYLHWTRGLPGVGILALAAATLLALWGVCASWWTLREFDIGTAWRQVHLLSVYIGTLGVVFAAAAGAVWLYVDRQMRGKDHRAQRLDRLGRLASLESLEAAVTRSATLGFLLLTVALATGIVIATAESPTRLGTGWWYSPKVVLAAAAWLIFALVMNVRYVATFRGRRAAVLSIIGFVLLIAVFGIVQMLPSQGTEGPREPGNRGALRVHPPYSLDSSVPGSLTRGGWD
jgi:ABC-type uncharacterized transport system permease subunit